MKKILIDGTGGSNWIGGLYYKNNIIFSLLQNKYIKDNYKIIVLTEKENKKVFLTNGNDIVIKTLDIKNLKLRKIAIIAYAYTHACKIIFPASGKMTRLRWINGVSWIADFQYKHYPKFFSEDTINQKNKLYSGIANNSNPLVLSSQDCMDDFNKYFSDTRKNIYVIHFVSNIEQIIREIDKKSENYVLEKCSLKRKRYAVIMNQFWQHKNHIVVFKAIKTIMDKYRDLDFQFVFTGKMEDYRNPKYIEMLKKIANDEFVASHIKMLGFIDRKEQIILMKNASFVVQPSLFEGWGTVLEDAKVLDKTVLLSDIPVHREQRNKKSILFAPNDSELLSTLILEEIQKTHDDDINQGIADMYKRAEDYSKGFEYLLKDLDD